MTASPYSSFTYVQRKGRIIFFKRLRVPRLRRKNRKFKRAKIRDLVFNCYFLLIKYSCMALAAFLPIPIALMTVAAPVATSPPA